MLKNGKNGSLKNSNGNILSCVFIMNTQDVIYTILIFAAFIYMYVVGFLAIQKDNITKRWSDYKCKPSIIPFASYYGPPGTSTADNFQECLTKMSEKNMFDLISPLGLLFKGITDQSDNLSSNVSGLHDLMGNMTNSTNNMFSMHSNLLINVISGVYKILANMKDTTERTVTVNEYLKALIDDQSKIIYILGGPTE